MIGLPHARRPALGRRSTVGFVVTSPLWKAVPSARAVVRRAIAEAACAVPKIPKTMGEIAVVLTDDTGIQALNRDWRHDNAPTNVLAFPAVVCRLKAPREGTGRRSKAIPAVGLLGDIVIAYETTKREAQAECKPFAHHLAHLAVHGYLHLVGYDHKADPEAEAMEEMETTILARLDVPDPYSARDARA